MCHRGQWLATFMPSKTYLTKCNQGISGFYHKLPLRLIQNCPCELEVTRMVNLSLIVFYYVLDDLEMCYHVHPE